ncbi:transmembrane protein [Thalictrum thalictroides]|uniref:Transmembrane protein n=1 Tax=Thalictrum thalictroides TaxID=46969 RepID=A0A7J6VGK3_THATH|nr:transmembrane protein [Thalictrum thalictroides]
MTGILVSYSAPARHGCLRVVENNYCTSKRGGVRCLVIVNVVFGVIFGLLAMFLGSSLLTLGSSCSLPLFWCYEIASWGLVILYGGTAFFLRRKAAVILDEGEFSGRNFGLEMLETTPRAVTPDAERRVNEGFKTWMGSSLLSSDEEDGPDDYLEIAHPTRTSSGRQRV